MDLGDLVVSIRLRTEALEKGLEQTQRKLKEQEKATKEAAATQRELQSAYAQTAFAATAAFVGIVTAVMSGVRAHNEYKNSMVGLQSIAAGVGADMGKLQSAVDDLTKDGLMPASDAATALKNLLSRGFTEDQAVTMLNRLKDAASFGRQSALGFGEAIRSAAEGLKNENSILVDNAGVTKNVSVMWKEYAETIGKSVNDLTLAEKRQAEFNGIMEETKFQVGDAAKYAAEFSGQQAALAADTTKLSQAFGGSMIPILQQLIGIISPVVNLMTYLINTYPGLTAAITAMSASISLMVAVIGTVIAAKMAWAAATRTLGVALSTLAFNPVVLGLTVLAGILAAVAIQKAKVREETEKLKNSEEAYQRVVQNGIEQHEIAMYEEKIKKLKELKSEYDETKQKKDDLATAFQEQLDFNPDDKKVAELKKEFDETSKALGLLEGKFLELESSAENAGRDIETFTKEIKKAKDGTKEQVQEQAKLLAGNAREIMQLENLIKQYKSAKTGSSEWASAQNDLATMFPQFSSALGINIEAIEGLAVVKRQEMEVAWQSMQVKAMEIKTAKEAAAAQIELEIATSSAGATSTEYMKARIAELKALKGEIVSLNALIGVKPSEVTGFKPVEAPKTSTKSDTYQNKALDDAYRQLEHKKRLDQLTIDQEINTLETIKNRYVKTAEEKMEIEERLYDARKTRAEESKEREEEMLDEAMQQYRASVEDRLASERLTSEQQYQLQRTMYDNIIRDNEAYLKRVLADDKYTKEEKAQIQKDITETIRTNINERLQLERDYYDGVQSAQIDGINNLSQGVQSALREKYAAEQTAAEGALKQQLDNNEKWRKDTIDTIKTITDTRIKAAEQAADAEIARINSVYTAQIDAINDQLAALDEAEKKRTRAEEDAADEQRLSRLREKLAFEPDEYNKVQIQKEINKILADQEKRHQKEQLDDKKETLKAEQKTLQDKLKEETDAIKQQLEDKKAVIKAEQDAQVASITFIAEQQKKSLDNQLAATQAHYANLLLAKNLQVEAEKMIVSNQQKDIIALLQGFGNDYQLTGQTLGDKLLAGFKTKVAEIQSLIAGVNAQIDSARSAAVAALNSTSSPVGAVAAGVGVGAVVGANVTVNNTFNTPVTKPSDVAKATEKAAQKLVL